ncbi:MAG: hypothetical protein JWR80_6032 [Bradyrhizobium sp.]|nr:hypothetical protein [Bradyrhizobium sp.]
MSGVPTIPDGRVDLRAPGTRRLIDLDALDGRIDDAVDIMNCTITGTARAVHELERHNFISCVFETAFFRDIDLSGCDVKDTLVLGCGFSGCRINAATHTASIYKETEFNGCNFHNAAITDSEYHHVRFSGCDLDNVLIKNCRFYDSTFVECATSTHVFENCIFVRTSLDRTEIELRTIISNFGLKSEIMTECRIRDGRINRPFGYVPLEEIPVAALRDRDDPLAILSIRYFVDGHLLGAEDGFDEAFDLRRWAQMARQPASFAQLIELFAEFLVTAYENSEVDMHKLLLLHDVTRQIVYDRSPDAVGYRYAVSFGGIHLALSRFVEDYLDALYAAWDTARPDLWVIAEGPLSGDYFEDRLAGLLSHSDLRIGEVRPYNSVLLQLVEVVDGSKLFALALILASFVKVELKATRSSTFRLPAASDEPAAAGTGVVLAADSEPFEFFHIASGMTGDKKRAYELRVKSLVPTTSIVVDLKLAVSTGFVRKVRQVIVRIADDC